ncbi:hypothetical protein FI667_g12580, partial [Globisporangium splendens]
MQLKIQPNYDRHEESISPHWFARTVALVERSFGEMKGENEEESKLFCIRLLAEEYCFDIDQANTLLALFKSHTSQVEKATAAAVLIPQIYSAGAATTMKEDVYDCASMETPVEFFEDKDKDGKIDVCGDICMVIGLKNLPDIEQGRPYSICTALNDAAFETFLKEFKQLDASAEMKLVRLRSILTLYYFTCNQAQRVMEHFGTFERDPQTGSLFPAEVFIILFSRIVDEWKFGESLALLDLIMKTQVLDRIGCLNCFHPMQSNETYEHLLLDVFDQRQLVLVVLKLAISGEAELTNVVLNNETTVDSDEWKTWTSDDKLPAQGSLSFSMRATQVVQSEAQLPPNSQRKKLCRRCY